MDCSCNKFNRQAILRACWLMLSQIKTDREVKVNNLRDKHRQYRKYWFFGPWLKRTDDEIDECIADEGSYSMAYLKSWGHSHEDRVNNLQRYAENLTCDEIGLTMDQFNCVGRFYVVI